eukprot:745966-Amphidinium_carterae.1
MDPDAGKSSEYQSMLQTMRNGCSRWGQCKGCQQHFNLLLVDQSFETATLREYARYTNLVKY